MTMIESAMFAEGWRETLGIDYQDLQWPTTGERLTEDSFVNYLNLVQISDSSITGQDRSKGINERSR